MFLRLVLKWRFFSYIQQGGERSQGVSHRGFGIRKTGLAGDQAGEKGVTEGGEGLVKAAFALSISSTLPQSVSTLPKKVQAEQAITILRETAVIPDLVIHVVANKPAIDQVVVNVLDQLSLGTNRVQGLNQAGAQQALRWNRGVSRLRVQCFEVSMQRRQKAIHKYPQFAQRVRHRNPLFQCPVAEHLRLGHVGAANKIYISSNLKDKLYFSHGMGKLFQLPVNRL